MTAILVADNETHWLDEMSDIIKAGGYKVVPAGSPKEAMAVIGHHQVDIAVLDLRLQDDSKYDVTGLNVALESDRMVPKIIVSEFGDVNDVIHALKIDVDAYPAIVDFVEKGQIQTKLILAIEHAIKVKDTWLGQSQAKISNRLKDDYDTARKEAKLHYNLALWISIVFVFIIIIGAYKLHTERGGWGPLLLGITGVLIAEITNYFFSKKLEFLYRRVERYHEELLQTDRFGQLMAISSSIKDEATREECKTTLFSAATAQWIGNSARKKSDGSGKHSEIRE